MIEDQLFQFGVLGIWMVVMLYDKQVYQKNMKKVIENNTRALTEFLLRGKK